MLDVDTKRRIETARDILVGKVPDPKSQVEQITIALIYKFMDDMDQQSIEMGGKASFFTGEYAKYAWSNIFNPRLGGFEMLALYADAITNMSLNPNLPQLFRDIFKNAFLPYRDPETLKLFLKTINEFTYEHSERLGDAFEYLLSILGSQGDAGQFRTPRHIIDFMVQVIKPQKNETILDPACGTAGFLISAYKYILECNKKKYPGDQLNPQERSRLLSNFKGYDISPDMGRLSRVNMFLHGFQQPQIYEYDTLTSEERWNEYADVILANPPFMSPKGGIRPHKRFSVQSSRSEVLFVDYMAEHLTPTGRAAIIVPEGIIFQSAGAYKQLRKYLVEKDFLWAVVSLPGGVFNPYAGVKTSILFLDRSLANKTDKILFVKVEADGFDLGAQRRVIEKNDLPASQASMESWQKAVREGNTSIFDTSCQLTKIVLVSKTQLSENGGYDLSADRYRKEEYSGNRIWPMVPLGDYCEIFGGGTPSKANSDFWTGGTVKWLSSKYINDQMEIIGYDLITEKAVKLSSTRVIPRGSTILISRVSVGKYAFADEEYAINQDLTAVYPGDKIDNKFLFAIARNLARQIEYNAQGIGVKGVTRDFIQKLQIPLPPLEIQRQIVDEIAGHQRIIDGARQVVEGWKPNIEHELETQRPNKITEWPIVKLGEVCTINPKKAEISHLPDSMLVSFVPMEDLEEGSIHFTVKKEREKGEVYKGYTYFRDRDVLLAKVTPCFENGKSGIAEKLRNGIGFGSSEYHVLRATDKVFPEYIYYVISQKKFIFEGKPRMTGTGGLQRVPADFISSYRIPLPPLDVQQAIITRIEHERNIVESNRELIRIYEEKIQKVIERVWAE